MIIVSGVDRGGDGHAEELSGDSEWRAPVDLVRTPMELGPMGPRVSQMDPRSGVEHSVVTSLGSTGAGASSSGGAEGYDGSGQSPRDPTSGKVAMVAEESIPIERPAHIERVEFMPPVGSSSHEPTMSSDLAEFVGHDRLARLMREAPRVVEAVLTAREERLEEIARWNEQERLIGEQEAVARDQGDYEPLHDSYDNEQVLRDSRHHLSVSWEQRGAAASSRGHGGPAYSLELYNSLPERVRDLVDAVGFGPFIQTLTAVKSDHALLTALAERWWDTSNSFHFPLGKMTVTPTDFVAITGLRVGGDPIPFDSGIHGDREALRWFLGHVPAGSAEMVPYKPFKQYLQNRVPTSELEEAPMARAYLLYLFGATLYPNKRSTVHLSYLPALRDLRTTSRFDWGGAALGACYGFLWAYEVLRMFPPENNCREVKTLPRAMIWGPLRIGKKKSRKGLMDFRLYLDELSSIQVDWDPWVSAVPELEYLARSGVVAASRVLLESAFGWQWYLGDRVTRQSLGLTEFLVPGPLSSRASHTNRYTLAELQRFTMPEATSSFTRPTRDYAMYQR
ncbi:hypothetical protein RHMOL_Rhmol09G0081900 [Rhododendron molle]|uniref:Uncharacterized protein n=1 Tax=Rhododendron molle TaxID=49168 RepID=A0ACC0MCQ5_RHOML|nr:hypothetical protein RHMOL_Rhmol09G0081900 [Rhododendron molle]